MTSPWQANGQGTYSVPGLGELLRARNADTLAAIGNIGRFSGAVGAGTIGAGQGFKNSTVFGDGTTPGQGAFRGALMNFNNAENGGGAPSGGNSDMGGMARLVNGGGGNGGVNFKQFAALGKAADGVRDSIKAVTPALPDQQPAILGMTDDQWKHAGTADKVTALQSWKQSQDVKTAMQAYDMGQLHMKQVQDQMKSTADDTAAWDRFGAGYQDLTQGVPVAQNPMVDPNSPVQSPMVNMAAQALANPQPLNGQEMLGLAIRSGVKPADALTVAKSAQEVARAQRETSQNSVPRKLNLDGTPVIFSEKTGTFQIDPAYTVQQRSAAAKDLLDQRLNGLSANEQLTSLDRQEKFLTSSDALVTMTDEERTSKLAAVQERRQMLVAGKSGGGAPASPASSRFKIVEMK